MFVTFSVDGFCCRSLVKRLLTISMTVFLLKLVAIVFRLLLCNSFIFVAVCSISMQVLEIKIINSITTSSVYILYVGAFFVPNYERSSVLFIRNLFVNWFQFVRFVLVRTSFSLICAFQHKLLFLYESHLCAFHPFYCELCSVIVFVVFFNFVSAFLWANRFFSLCIWMLNHLRGLVNRLILISAVKLLYYNYWHPCFRTRYRNENSWIDWCLGIMLSWLANSQCLSRPLISDHQRPWNRRPLSINLWGSRRNNRYMAVWNISHFFQ